MNRLVGAVVAALIALTAQPAAAAVKVLAAAATQPALDQLAEVYRKITDIEIDIAYSSTPELQAKLQAGEPAQVVVGPQAVIQTFTQSGRLARPSLTVGRAGLALAVRKGAAQPDISSEEALKAALLGAKAVVFSQATSGTYVEGLIRRLGLEAQLAGKIVRVSNGPAVVDRLASGTGDEVGFSASTELRIGEPKGVVSVGLLPAALQFYAVTEAGADAASTARPDVQVFLALIRSPTGRAILRENGLE